MGSWIYRNVDHRQKCDNIGLRDVIIEIINRSYNSDNKKKQRNQYKKNKNK